MEMVCSYLCLWFPSVPMFLSLFTFLFMSMFLSMSAVPFFVYFSYLGLCSYLFLWLSFLSTILYLSMVFVCAMIPVSALLCVSIVPICIYVPIGLHGFCLCVISFCVFNSYLYLFFYVCLWFLYVSRVPISVYGFYLLSVMHSYVFLWLLY